MARQRPRHDPVPLMQGTVDMLVLRTLLLGPAHGHRIAHLIQQTSDGVLRIDHGSLYPALHRLIRRGWISAKSGTSENNRRAKYYQLTARGRRQLVSEAGRWERLVEAIGRIMRPAGEEE